MLVTNQYRIMLLLLFAVGSAMAEEAAVEENQTLTPTIAETTFLKAKEGYIGDQLGAEVKDVVVVPDSKMRLVEVYIPYDPARVDSIQIVTESGNTLKQDRIYQVIKDYENDNLGIKFYLPKQKNWAFKIKLIDESYRANK